MTCMFFGKEIVKNALQVSRWEKLCMIIKNESEVAQSCPTLCDPMESARLLHPWDFPGKNTGADSDFLLQQIFLTQGSNPGLPHCRQTLYHLSHQGVLTALPTLQHTPSLWILYWYNLSLLYYIETNSETVASSRGWTRSINLGIPKALFVVMLSKAHLTSHSKMSGSRLVITSS